MVLVLQIGIEVHFKVLFIVEREFGVGVGRTFYIDHFVEVDALSLTYLVGQLSPGIGDAGARVLLIELGHHDIDLVASLPDFQSTAGILVPRASKLKNLIVIFLGYFHDDV